MGMDVFRDENRVVCVVVLSDLDANLNLIM